MYFLILLFLSSNGFSEDTFQEVIERGIKLYKNQEYERALKVFGDAEKINPNSDLVNLELAMTYFELESYRKSYIYSKKVIESGNKELRAQSYVIMSKSLYNRMKRKDAIKLLENAIDEIGDNDVLNYCIAEIHYDLENYELTYKYLQDALKFNFYNSDCHFLIHIVYEEFYKYDFSIISSFYHLLLNPKNDKSAFIFYYTYRTLLNHAFQESFGEEVDLVEYLVDFKYSMSYDMSLMVNNNMRTKMNTIINKFLKSKGDLSKFDFFKIESLKLLDSIVVYDYNDFKYSELINQYYIPFFKELLNSEHRETFIYYISNNFSDEAATWLNKNPAKVEEFFKWLQGN